MLDISTLIAKAEAAWNNPQLGSAAEIVYPIQEKEVNGVVYELTVVIKAKDKDQWTKYGQ